MSKIKWIDDSSESQNQPEYKFKKFNPNQRCVIRILPEKNPDPMKHHWMPVSPCFVQGKDRNSCPICDHIESARAENINRINAFVNSLGDSALTQAIKESLKSLAPKTDALDSLLNKLSRREGFDANKPKTYDPKSVKITFPDGSSLTDPLKTVKKGQLTTTFDLTVDYIRKNIMPILYNYSLHEVDAFSALFAKFRKDADYAVVLKVVDTEKFPVTPEIMITLVTKLYDDGLLK